MRNDEIHQIGNIPETKLRKGGYALKPTDFYPIRPSEIAECIVGSDEGSPRSRNGMDTLADPSIQCVQLLNISFGVDSIVIPLGGVELHQLPGGTCSRLFPEHHIKPNVRIVKVLSGADQLVKSVTDSNNRFDTALLFQNAYQLAFKVQSIIYQVIGIEYFAKVTLAGFVKVGVYARVHKHIHYRRIADNVPDHIGYHSGG